MIRLSETAAGTLRCLLPPGQDAASWHAALVGEITHHLSPAHAGLLARPEPVAGGSAWFADGVTRTRYAELPIDGRRALDAALGAVLSDIRRLAESGAASAVREAWPSLREIPDMGHVFAVDGRPVLAAWGHAGAGASGRLARLDDDMAWSAKPSPPWTRYGAALGTLAALALAAGLLLPLAPSWFVDQPAACTIVPGQLDAWRGEMELDGRGQELRTLLATLNEEIGRRQLLCPITAILPAPAPPSRADLPQDRWEQHDLSMLDGCWSLYTTITVSRGDGSPESVIRSWRQCFDGHGAGHQTVVLEDGRRCEGVLTAAFDQEAILRVSEPSACQGTLQLTRSERLCRRLGDAEAECDGRSVEGSRSGHTYAGRFRR
jgi:hypothetical protein